MKYKQICVDSSDHHNMEHSYMTLFGFHKYGKTLAISATLEIP